MCDKEEHVSFSVRDMPETICYHGNLEAQKGVEIDYSKIEKLEHKTEIEKYIDTLRDIVYSALIIPASFFKKGKDKQT